MLLLSEILLADGDRIASFEELKVILKETAVKRGELFFKVDIDPPAFTDRHKDWYDQLNITFESAR